MEYKVNITYIKNAVQMFRNIELLKMELTTDDTGRQCIELIFYKPDDSEFKEFGASGKMLKDSLTEAIDNQYSKYNVLTLDKNIFSVVLEPVKGVTFRI